MPPIQVPSMQVEWTQLLLPILLSTIAVFIVSSIIHMVLQMHKGDHKRLPNEDEVRDAIRRGAAAPGQYMIPHCYHSKGGPTPEDVKRFTEGPVGFLYLRESGMPKLGPFLGAWILYSAIVTVLAAYMAQSTLDKGDSYLSVFRVVSMSAWLAYAWASPSDSIWKCKPWAVTLRSLFDGLVYASVTAGIFAWLWPR
ncbi:MAG: hypothetical protein ACKVS6_11815 [Planctomycetota bacterium]